MRRRTVGVPLTREQFAALVRIAKRPRSKSSVLLDGLRALEKSIAPALPPTAPHKGKQSRHASAYLDKEASALLRRLCLLFRWNECEVLRAGIECLAQQEEDDHVSSESKTKAARNRMDREDLEPRSRVRQSKSRLQKLLCDAASGQV